MTYVFIMSLDHSRSTIADIFIAQNVNGISLGEVRRTLLPQGAEKFNRKICSCGASFEKCEFWSSIRMPEDLITADTFIDRTLVDSSKEISHLQKFYPMLDALGHRVIVIVMIKSFDDWYKSVLSANSRHSREFTLADFLSQDHKLAFIRLLFRKIRFIAFLEWVYTNYRLIRAGADKEYYLVFSSENLRTVVNSMQKKQGLKAERHIVRGNRVSLDSDVTLRDFELKWWEERLFKFLAWVGAINKC